MQKRIQKEMGRSSAHQQTLNQQNNCSAQQTCWRWWLGSCSCQTLCSSYTLKDAMDYTDDFQSVCHGHHFGQVHIPEADEIDDEVHHLKRFFKKEKCGKTVPFWASLAEVSRSSSIPSACSPDRNGALVMSRISLVPLYFVHNCAA